jgi:hypothetical protein
MDGRTRFSEARQASYVADFKGGQNFGEGQGCIIVTIGLPESRLFTNRALEFSL